MWKHVVYIKLVMKWFNNISQATIIDEGSFNGLERTDYGAR